MSSFNSKGNIFRYNMIIFFQTLFAMYVVFEKTCNLKIWHTRFEKNTLSNTTIQHVTSIYVLKRYTKKIVPCVNETWIVSYVKFFLFLIINSIIQSQLRQYRIKYIENQVMCESIFCEGRKRADNIKKQIIKLLQHHHICFCFSRAKGINKCNEI